MTFERGYMVQHGTFKLPAKPERPVRSCPQCGGSMTYVNDNTGYVENAEGVRLRANFYSCNSCEHCELGD